jgi:hypothetical protein
MNLEGWMAIAQKPKLLSEKVAAKSVNLIIEYR